MRTVRLGPTGLEVSALCLGCMSFGEPARGQHPWTLPLEDCRSIVRRALDLGFNFLDTANAYSDGSSEEIVGQLVRDFVPRDDVVIATKVFFTDHPGPNRGGLSRKAILRDIDASLRRLGTDHVDLYQVHRWDYQTPLEETLEALHDVVKAGKARYLGASSMFAWQFAQALYTQRLNGWTGFVSMQDQVNLLYREEEREMLPLCADRRIGVLAWSPLARGRLTRDPGAGSPREASDAYGRKLFAATEAADRAVIEAVAGVAAARGVPRAQVALAWVLRHTGRGAPIVGATQPAHLDDAVAALDLRLTNDEVAALESPYVPHAVAGFE